MLQNDDCSCACPRPSRIAVPASAQEPPASPQVPTIVTTGEAIVRRAPDQAFVVAAVETRARRSEGRAAQNAEAMTAVQQRLAASGIAKDAVRTLGYNIQQEFDFANGRRVPRGYVARNAVEVRVDALERARRDSRCGRPGRRDHVSGVRFDLNDRAGAEREALRLAVADARARAEAAAAGAGRTIDRVLRIDDTRREPPRPDADGDDGARGGAGRCRRRRSSRARSRFTRRPR